MKTKLRYSRQYTDKLRTKPTISNYIQWIETAKYRRLILYARASRRTQKENLESQISKLGKEVKKRGIEVVYIFSEIVGGHMEMNDEYSPARSKFYKAIALAHRSGCGILAESVCRFRRGWMSKENKQKKGQRPLSIFEIETLMEEAKGVPLVTIVHPDSPPDKGNTRSYQTKRGQSEKNKKGGRLPIKRPKKEKRKRLWSHVMQMRKAGIGWGTISEKTGVSIRTVRDWIRRKNA
jgi:DNA invertase Pin-like site-specific DNA recombinase